MIKRRVVFFEAEGGSDKWLDGHRRDTQPIVFALKARGWDAEIIFYRDEWKERIIEYCADRFDAYISRVNPGNLAYGESEYFDMLRELSDKHDMLGMAHPDAMISFGAKDALVKLRHTSMVPDDTYAYYTMEEFTGNFPTSLSLGERVLKQNRGSTGTGIWRVSLADERTFEKGTAVPLDAKVKCTEAVDNHVEFHTLGDFMNFCEQYIVGDNGMLVDMQFLPRIKEGEIRILMVGSKPIFVVHKKPAEGEDSFSATLFSGAKYTYDSPDKWEDLVSIFLSELPSICGTLGRDDIPLIWTADFILDTDESGEDKYILGEINCSCVGFTSHLEEGIQAEVAREIIRSIESRTSEAQVPA
jgi:hypothetical protein